MLTIIFLVVCSFSHFNNADVANCEKYFWYDSKRL